MQLVKDEAKQHFWPAQVGVAVPAGAETAVHTVRAWLVRNSGASGKILVKLDFSNAFNNISCQAMLAAVTSHFPGPARWVAWCYHAPTRLCFGERAAIPSAAGVQQGDP